MYQDKTLACRDCGAEFAWSAGEQEFFAQKGFDKPPTRCPECRKKRRNERDGGKPASSGSVNSGPKQMHPIICSNCGKEGQVPFEPKSASVLCATCFKNRSGQPTEAVEQPKVTEPAESAQQ